MTTRCASAIENILPVLIFGIPNSECSFNSSPVNRLGQRLQQSEDHYDIRDRPAERLVLMDAITEGVQEGYKFKRKFSLCVWVCIFAGMALGLRVDPNL